MTETGPYGFVKYTYKYDVSFDSLKRSNEVTFKEYSILREPTDSVSCEVQYFLRLHLYRHVFHLLTLFRFVTF
jgi:hypothetical protein